MKKKELTKDELNKQFKKNNVSNFKSKTIMDKRPLIANNKGSDSIKNEGLQKKNMINKCGEDFFL